MGLFGACGEWPILFFPEPFLTAFSPFSAQHFPWQPVQPLQYFFSAFCWLVCQSPQLSASDDSVPLCLYLFRPSVIRMLMSLPAVCSLYATGGGEACFWKGSWPEVSQFQLWTKHHSQPHPPIGKWGHSWHFQLTLLMSGTWSPTLFELHRAFLSFPWGQVQSIITVYQNDHLVNRWHENRAWI